jgi:methyl-accepting chemotaxis protein
LFFKFFFTKSLKKIKFFLFFEVSMNINSPSLAPVFRAFPYVKVGLNKLFKLNPVTPADELNALAVLGSQISGAGAAYGLFKLSLKICLSSGLVGSIFLRCHKQAVVMKNLEEILQDIKKNNRLMKKHLEDFKKETDKKITALNKNIVNFKKNNKYLKNSVTDLNKQLKILKSESSQLKNLIETTETTVENLEKLKHDEKQALERLENINKKLELVTELLSDEKKKLSSEVKKLSSEINRLSEIKA